MDIKAIAQDELAKVIAAHTSVVVSVVSGSNTAEGVKDTATGEADLGDDGEMGSTAGRVYCNADTIGTISNGQTITVDELPANVMNVDTDPAGAIVTIDYTLQKPK